ncbi:hypothetical protein BP5796_07891 [Coleophoma crateriformis]|uniref:FAD dependent oxidoreductase domain-containing protein n=1 Tax=Coleophoma crateriformis TaxID=565419 RepID=A0A3D8RCS6_9HELO|nr:hypothetical protein BP5796_07891 [Coleophoma crateriformis]
MEKRTAIPVSLPRNNPTISYWQDPPDVEAADFTSADQVPETADTVVIGSGISGACIAWGLLEKGEKDVVMLEARQACSGATGRNGGHTKAASYKSFLDNAAKLGTTEAIKIARLEYQNIKDVHAFSRTHGIDCDLYSGDTVDIIYDQQQWDSAHVAVETMRRTMPDDLDGAARYVFWNAEETASKFHTKGERPIGSVSYFAGSLSAYKFVVGVLKMCLKSGMRLWTNTPAFAVTKGPDGLWKIETSKGSIKARNVVLATNGYTAFLEQQFQGVIVPLRGQITAHRPGRNQPSSGLGVTYSFVYADGYEYMIPRPVGSKFAGDIIIGGGLMKAPSGGLSEFGNTDDTSKNPIITEYLTETTARYFGPEAWGEDHPDGRIRKEWTGIMGYSSDGFPFVGSMPGKGKEGLWISASFQGHGMVLCFRSALALVGIMTGGEEEVEKWFPAAFRMSEERLKIPFEGRLHTGPPDVELSTKI